MRLLIPKVKLLQLTFDGGGKHIRQGIKKPNSFYCKMKSVRDEERQVRITIRAETYCVLAPLVLIRYRFQVNGFHQPITSLLLGVLYSLTRQTSNTRSE